jgi:hypothetical protein
MCFFRFTAPGRIVAIVQALRAACDTILEQKLLQQRNNSTDDDEEDGDCASSSVSSALSKSSVQPAPVQDEEAVLNMVCEVLSLNIQY